MLCEVSVQKETCLCVDITLILAGAANMSITRHDGDNNSSISSSFASTLMCFTSRAQNCGVAVNRSLSSVARLSEFHIKTVIRRGCRTATRQSKPLARSCLKISKCPKFLTLKRRQKSRLHYLRLKAEPSHPGCPVFHPVCLTEEVGFAPGRRYLSGLSSRPTVLPPSSSL